MKLLFPCTNNHQDENMTDNWTPRETFAFIVFFMFCLWLAGVAAENL